MGFFSEIASEARRGMAGNQAKTSARQTAPTPPSPATQEPAPVPPVAAPEAQATRPVPAPEEAAPAPPAQETVPVPAEAKQEPVPVPEPPAPAEPAPPPELKLDADQEAAPAPDDDARRKAHEAAEAKRKAEWEAKQAEKKAARQAVLDKIAAMNSAELLAESVKRVAADTERLTRRNMKEAVAEHIQAKCREDTAFAMLVMDPGKSMANCFRYISRKAYEYIQDELKANGIKPGPSSEGYGCDVPDGLCYQWAEDYFNDPSAKEDHQDDEEFVPRPYVPTAANRKKAQGKAAKETPEKKKPAEEKRKDKADTGQITLGGFAPMEEKAG